MTNSKVSEKTVFKVAGECSRRLGIPLPEIVVQRGMGMFPWTSSDRNHSGYCYHDHISVNRTHTLRWVRETVAHELVHRAFPGLRHGPDFERRIKALQAGEMLFRGRMTARGKVDQLDDQVPAMRSSYAEKAELAEAKIREFDTKIKRLRTLRRKWVLRQKAWKRRDKPVTQHPLLAVVH